MSYEEELSELRGAFAHDRYVLGVIDDTVAACSRYLVAKQKHDIAKDGANGVDSDASAHVERLKGRQTVAREQAIRQMFACKKYAELIGWQIFRELPFSEEAFDEQHAQVVDDIARQLALTSTT